MVDYSKKMTTKRWAAEAFKKMVWQVTFMSEGAAKDELIRFLVNAPDEVKRECHTEFAKIPGL